MSVDKTLVCKDCSAVFVFSIRDQEFFAEKGFAHEPQRCRECRALRKSQRAAAKKREMFEAVCAACTGVAALPFRPKGDRPVYCRECFLAQAPVTT